MQMVEITDKIKDYCEYNGIDYDEYIKKCLTVGFNVIRFGTSPVERIKMENGEDVINKYETVKANEIEQINTEGSVETEPTKKPRKKRTTTKKEEKVVESAKEVEKVVEENAKLPVKKTRKLKIIDND